MLLNISSNFKLASMVDETLMNSEREVRISRKPTFCNHLPRDQMYPSFNEMTSLEIVRIYILTTICNVCWRWQQKQGYVEARTFNRGSTIYTVLKVRIKMATIAFIMYRIRSLGMYDCTYVCIRSSSTCELSTCIMSCKQRPPRLQCIVYNLGTY